MLYIDGDVISITKGDDAVLEITINRSDGTVYELEPTDTLTLTVREKPCEACPVLLTSTSAPGSNRIILTGDGTGVICPGRYSYDVQLNRAEGTRFTVIPDDIEPELRGRGRNWGNFIIMGEVTIP
jgi:hypothetical protein